MQNLIELRHILHAHPELSGREALTNKILNEWVRQTQPDQMIENEKTVSIIRAANIQVSLNIVLISSVS